MNAIVGPLVPDRPEDRAPPILEVEVARTLNDVMQVMAVRSLVYIGEQGCPYEEEYDGNDFAGATHLILRRGGEPVGVLRMRWFADFVKLERLAIRREFRSLAALMFLTREACRLAARKGYRRLMGHADPRIAPFWRRYFGARARGRGQVRFSDHHYVELEFDLSPPPDAITIDSDPLILIRPEGAWDRPGVLDLSALRGQAPAEDRLS